MAVTDADRVASVGLPVTLANGQELTLRFDFAALLTIEKRLGTFQGFLEALDDKKARGRIEAVAVGLAGAGHVPYEEIEANYDIRETNTYRDALVQALAEGFGRPGEGKAPSQAKRSRGPGSTTKRQSVSAGQTSSS